jgi:hypothetical protein
MSCFGKSACFSGRMLIGNIFLQDRNRDYVVQLEVYLSKLLNADGTRDEEDDELM